MLLPFSNFDLCNSSDTAEQQFSEETVFWWFIASKMMTDHSNKAELKDLGFLPAGSP